ncbi:flagellar assembly protein FliW [Bacillus weihaiensis]|uniref:Flagellar assembly factor FliW n=1 Tax=Bacillus weihaiensis TaxID=1547283 RepID=A0A1L3MMJ8_9BACI|nr:flagellar assembly protein FliW [Bacillus weihaiensis]APH03578.1 flagellar assembly protein FliW [Bacillus weihaiensis]
MKIETKYHGEITLEETSIMHFQNGLPGFIEEKKFVLLPLDSESPFMILQSIVTKDLGFILVNPFQFFHSYEFELSAVDKELLEIKEEKDVAVWTILTVKDPFVESTANLQAPVIFNIRNNVGKQVILNHTMYQTREKLFPEKIEK